jgi:hypothetical protein
MALQAGGVRIKVTMRDGGAIHEPNGMHGSVAGRGDNHVVNGVVARKLVDSGLLFQDRSDDLLAKATVNHL